MKMFIGIALLVTSLTSLAASVKVTSFNYIRSNNDPFHPLAELCGLVEGATSAPSFVRVTVDPGSRQGIYNTVAGLDGKFCVAVITFRGHAEASLFGESVAVKAQVQ